MVDVSADQLKAAVERAHDCYARMREVSETFQDQSVCKGVIHNFDLQGHSTAKGAYACSSPIEGSDKRRFYAVLHVLPVRSPADAVRAAIVSNYRQTHEFPENRS